MAFLKTLTAFGAQEIKCTAYMLNSGSKTHQTKIPASLLASLCLLMAFSFDFVGNVNQQPQSQQMLCSAMLF
jgi:hypothetical protein